MRIRVPFPRAIDVSASVAAYGRWGDDLLDRYDGRTLVRTVGHAFDDACIPFSADVPPGLTEFLDADIPEGGTAPEVAAAIGATFVTQTQALVELVARDERVAALAGRYPGFVPVLVPDPFHALVRSISAQQINLRWATVIRRRLADAYGARLETGNTFVHVLEAARLAQADVEDLRALQLTYAKARAVVATARAAAAGEFRRDDLTAMDDDHLIAHLTRLPGIGRWSAEWFLARTLGRPRVVAGDLGVRKAVGRLYDAGMPSEEETRRLTRHWGQAATVAQALALHDLAVSPSRTPAR